MGPSRASGSQVTGSSGESSKTASRPQQLLQPPSTIISPPSPVDAKSSGAPFLESPPDVSDEPEVQCESPASSPELSAPDLPSSSRPGSSAEERRTTPRPQHADGPGPIPAVDRIIHESTPSSSSTSKRDSLLPPESPELSEAASSSHSPFPRSPSPSSPGYHHARLGGHMRRRSSSHRVRETVAGEQKSTKDGERLINQYRIGKSLGKGAFAKVELAVDVGTGTEYAIKEFSKSRLQFHSLQEKHRMNTRKKLRRSRGGPMMHPDGQQSVDEQDSVGRDETLLGDEPDENDPLALIRREIAVMKKLDHPNLIKLYEAISVPNADALFLVLEYLPGGVLMTMTPGGEPAEPAFSHEQAKEYFRQLCLGLEYLHSNAIIHRDIKPENVLVSADRQMVKLCDFGVSEMFIGEGDDRIKKSGGSPAFLSPESFTSHHQEIHGRAVDIWALGGLPFNTTQPLELFELVKHKSPRILPEWPESLKDLINRMLEKDPDQRINMDAIRVHPWVTDDGDHPMESMEHNLHVTGCMVDEPTDEELRSAIVPKTVFTVVRAAQKFLSGLRRSRQHSQNTMSSPRSGLGSAAVSLTSGSMDSYTSNPPGTHSEVTSPEPSEGRDWLSAKVSSPSALGAGHDPDEHVPHMELHDGEGDAAGSSRPRQRPSRREDSQHRAERDDSADKDDRSPSRTERAESEAVQSDVTERFSSLGLSIDTRRDSQTTGGPASFGEAKPDSNDNDGFEMVESPVMDYPEEPTTFDSPVEADDEKEARSAASDGPAEEQQPCVQITDSPVDDEGGYSLVDSPVDAAETVGGDHGRRKLFP